jgi:hypothetical protein
MTWRNPGRDQERLSSIQDMLGEDTANNSQATTLVAANRDGSLVERIEYLYDLLVDDEATNLIGVDDSNNAAATTSVVANGDGSVLERLEELRDVVGARPATHTMGGGLMVVKAAAALPATTAAAIFTVTGLNEVVRLFGVVGTAIQNQTCNLKVTVNPTSGTSGDVAANLDIDNDEAGTFYIVEGDGSALIGVNAGTGWGGVGLPHPFLVNTGTIDIETGATNTGTVAWYCIYRPLAASASIVAA